MISQFIVAGCRNKNFLELINLQKYKSNKIKENYRSTQIHLLHLRFNNQNRVGKTLKSTKDEENLLS